MRLNSPELSYTSTLVIKLSTLYNDYQMIAYLAIIVNTCRLYSSGIRMFIIKFLTLFLCLVLSSQSVIASENLLIYENFEKDVPDWRSQTAKQTNLSVMPLGNARSGLKSIRFSVHKEEPWVAGGPRSELMLPKKFGYWMEGGDYWIGASVLFPTEYKDDPMQEIFWQVHAAKRDGGNRNKERRDTRRDKRWGNGSSRKTSSTNRGSRGSVPFLMQSIDDRIVIKGMGLEHVEIKKTKGLWMDIVVHHSWSSQNQGVTQVYINGDLIINKQNISNMVLGDRLYWKFGLYKSGWKRGGDKSSVVSRRDIWFDEVRVGGSNANFDDVTPRNLNP